MQASVGYNSDDVKSNNLQNFHGNFLKCFKNSFEFFDMCAEFQLQFEDKLPFYRSRNMNVFKFSFLQRAHCTKMKIITNFKILFVGCHWNMIKLTDFLFAIDIL